MRLHPMSNGKAGGGSASNKVVRSYDPKREPVPKAVDPKAVAHLGTSLGDNVTNKGANVRSAQTPLVHGAGYAAKGPTPVGVGPGAGRTVMASGSQATHGPTVPGTHGLAGEPMSRGILGPKGGRQP
jgi:hypothetical protein